MPKNLIYYVVTFTCIVSTVNTLQRIMKGKISEKDMFPYVASLWLYDEHACVASIITQQWVLTAAHCVFYKENKKIIEDSLLAVSVGNLTYKFGQIHRIDKKVVHEGFDYDRQVNDVAVLKVTVPFKFNFNVRPVRLNPYPVDDYERPIDCVVAGWGVNEETYATLTIVPTEKLRYAQVNTIPLSYCKHIYVVPNNTFIPSHTNICVFTMVGRGTCIGDSGAPLISNNEQIGILSIGGSCDNSSPEVYTRISSYYTWIKKAIGDTRNLCLNQRQ